MNKEQIYNINLLGFISRWIKNTQISRDRERQKYRQTETESEKDKDKR